MSETPNSTDLCVVAPPPPVPVDQPVEEEPFELPTLEEVARATGTLHTQPLGTSFSLLMSMLLFHLH